MNAIANLSTADMDSSYNRTVRPNQKNKYQSVIQEIGHYIPRECDDPFQKLVDLPSFKALSSDKKTSNVLEVALIFNGGWASYTDLLLQLVPFILVAAASGSKRAQYVATITQMEKDTQASIMTIIQQVSDTLSKLDDTKLTKTQKLDEIKDFQETGKSAFFEPPTSQVGDMEMELEVRYVTLLKEKRQIETENERIRNHLADMTTRHEYLSENNDHLQAQLTEAQDRLREAQRDSEQSHVIRRLEDKLQEAEDLIASQEAQIEQDREAKLRMRRDLDSNKDAASRLIELEDELRELRAENLELTKKANTVERYRQKLESQKAAEASLKNAEYENEQLRAQIRDFDSVMQKKEQLEREKRRFQDQIEAIEQEIFTGTLQRKTLEEDNERLEHEMEIMREKLAHDEQLLQDLREDGFRATPSPSPKIGGGTLGDELEEEHQQTQATVEVSRLRAENQILKQSSWNNQELLAMRTELEEKESLRKTIELKYRDAFEKEAIAQSQLRLMMSLVGDNTKFVELAMTVGKLSLLTPESYRHRAFVELREAHDKMTEDFTSLNKKHDALTAEHENVKRNVLQVESDLSMVGKDELDQLEVFKSTQESLTKSFEAELTTLEAKMKALTTDFDLQNSHLKESLLTNSKLRNMLEESGHDQIEKELVEREKAAIAQKTASVRPSSPIHVLKLSLGSMKPKRRSKVIIPERIIHASHQAHALMAPARLVAAPASSRYPVVVRRPESLQAPMPIPLTQIRQPPFLKNDEFTPPTSVSSVSSAEGASRAPPPVAPPSIVKGPGRSLTAAFPGGRPVMHVTFASDTKGNPGAQGTPGCSIARKRQSQA